MLYADSTTVKKEADKQADHCSSQIRLLSQQHRCARRNLVRHCLKRCNSVGQLCCLETMQLESCKLRSLAFIPLSRHSLGWRILEAVYEAKRKKKKPSTFGVCACWVLTTCCWTAVIRGESGLNFLAAIYVKANSLYTALETGHHRWTV